MKCSMAYAQADFSHDTFPTRFLFQFVNNSTATYSIVTVLHNLLQQSNIKKGLCMEGIDSVLLKN